MKKFKEMSNEEKLEKIKDALHKKNLNYVKEVKMV